MAFSYNGFGIPPLGGATSAILVPNLDTEMWFQPIGNTSSENGFISKYSANLMPIMFDKEVNVSAWGLFVKGNQALADWPGEGTVNRISFKAYVYEADADNRPHTFVARFDNIDIKPTDEGGPNGDVFIGAGVDTDFTLKANTLYWLGAAAVPEFNDGDTQVPVDIEFFDFLKWALYTGPNSFTSSIPSLDSDIGFMNFGPNV
jgi:hypothetical protein